MEGYRYVVGLNPGCIIPGAAQSAPTKSLQNLPGNFILEDEEKMGKQCKKYDLLS